MDTIKCHALQVKLLGGNSESFKTAKKQKEYFNFLIGKDKSKWASKVRAYEEVLQKDVYPGVDVLWQSSHGQLKYDLLLSPGASIESIQFSYAGHDSIFIEDGKLLVETSVGPLVEQAPYAYQIIDEEKILVNCRFELNDDIVSFEVSDSYDPSYELVIDPTVVFSTYSGSQANNFGYTATFDSRGNLYGGGSAFGRPGQDYPLTPGAYQTVYGGGNVDMGITKYSDDGSTRIYSTYLGGDNTELPHSFFVNGKDELFIFGTTSSLDYPTTPNAFDTTFNGGSTVNLANGLGVIYDNGSDMVISRLSADGTQLLASTYLGGTDNDGLVFNAFLRYNYADQVRGEVFIDDENNCYIASATYSTDLPVDSSAFQSISGGTLDGCLFKLDNDLTTVLWGTYIGGSGGDAAYSLVLDNNGNPYAAGGTMSSDLPTTAGSYQPGFAGGRSDGFIYHFDQSGQILLEGTYYGKDSAYDQIYFVEKDNEGNIFVLGQTDAPDSSYIFNAPYSTPNSGQFISRFSSDLDSLFLSVAFGRGDGSPDICPTAFLVDLCNKIYVAGWGGGLNSDIPGGLGRSANSTTNGLDITPSSAYQTTTDGNDFYLMVLEDDASVLVYATYFGGNSSGDHVDGGTSRFDRNGIVYQSVCASCGPANNDFPIVPGPGQVVSGTDQSNNGTGSQCNNAVFKFDLELPLAIADFDVPPSGCAPYIVNFSNNSELVDSTRAVFSWDFGDGSFSNLKDPSHTYMQTGVYDISLAIFDSSSCNLTDTISKRLIVLSNEIDSLPGDTVCPNTPTPIGLGVPQDTSLTFQWTPSTGLNLTNIANPIVNISSDITYQVYVSNGLCTDTFILPVAVDVENIQIVGDTIACSPDTVTLIALRSAAGPDPIYQWEPQALVISGQGSDTVRMFLDRDTTINLRYVTGSDCPIRVNQAVPVFDFPLITAPLDPNICPGDTTQLFVGNGFPLFPLTYAWTPSSRIIGDTGSDSPNVAPQQSSWFFVTGDNGLGCVYEDSVLVVVLEGQNTTFPPIIQCDTGGVVIGPQLSDTTLFLLDSTLTYSWAPGSGLSDSSIPRPTASVQGNENYQLLVSNGNCADTFNQEVLFDVNVIFLQAEGPYCLNDTANVQLGFVTPSPGYSVDWQPRPPVIGNPPGANADVLMSDTATISATVTLTNGCEYVASIFLDLIEPSEAIVTASADPDSIYPGYDVNLTSEGANIVSYSWSPGATIDSPSAQNTLANPRDQTVFRVDVVDSNGCPGSDTTIVYVRETICRDPFIYVPNAFSPNGDGDNDLLFVRGNNLTEMYFAVYDRWGQLMFETRDQSEGWDGTFQGQALDPAVFAWYLEGLCDDGFEIFLKGDVTILR